MYKFSSIKYNEQLFKIGILRIGTLYDFRNQEHKKGILDRDEGKKTIVHNVQNIDITDSKNLTKEEKDIKEAWEKQGSIKIEEGGRIIANNIISNKNINSKNYFIYCTSSSLDARKKFRETEYDSCYEISSPTKFFNEITNMLNRITPVKFLGYHNVHYKERKEKYEKNGNNIPPFLIKELEYKGQFEIRAIWEPIYNGIEIKPILLSSYKLGKYMKYIKL